MPLPQKFMHKYVTQDDDAWQKCSDLRNSKLRAMILQKKTSVNFSITGFTTYKYTLQSYNPVGHQIRLTHRTAPAIMCAPLIKHKFHVMFNPVLMVVAVAHPDHGRLDFPIAQVEHLTWASFKKVVCGLVHVLEIEFVSDGELMPNRGKVGTTFNRACRLSLGLPA